MRRSFKQASGGPMGGGGGGGMIKTTVHRAVRAATGGLGSSPQPFSHSNTNHNFTTNSPSYKPSSSDNNSNTLSFSSNHHLPPMNHPNWPDFTSPNGGEEYDGVHGWFHDDSVFGTVPSMDEVNYAVSSLQQVLDLPSGSHESGREFDWIEPSRSMFQSTGSQSVYDAFRLLQTEPSVKRIVISLSSDKSVWEAVMNNEVVRELRDSVYEAKKVESCDGSISVPDVLPGIFINTKAKVMEIVEKITKMVNKLFQSPRNEKKAKGEGPAVLAAPFEKKLRSSFCLSVMVILIIVVSRVCRS